jgi:inward rectifier potassium channel
MAFFTKKTTGELELGFGKKAYSSNSRFLNEDGSVNIKRTGMGMENIDFYNWLITTSSFNLAVVILTGYILVNFVFAVGYYLVGPENFGGITAVTEMGKFFNLFFFSAQTLTTLGYGHMHPISNSASVIAALESLLGLMSFALATGVLYGRFSRPKADLLYSEKIVVAPYDDINGLMFRIANKKQYELIELEANIVISFINPISGKREFERLNLEVSRINFIPLSWTIVHPIDSSSPVFGWKEDDFSKNHAEVIILIRAINDTFSQTVYSRKSYKSNELIYGAKFKPLPTNQNKRGKISVSVTDIHKYDIVKLNEVV